MNLPKKSVFWAIVLTILSFAISNNCLAMAKGPACRTGNNIRCKVFDSTGNFIARESFQVEIIDRGAGTIPRCVYAQSKDALFSFCRNHYINYCKYGCQIRVNYFSDPTKIRFDNRILEFDGNNTSILDDVEGF